MSYALENLVRECSEIKSPSARLLAMVLATSADNKTFKCRPGWKCLMHWCKFSSKGTMSRAMKEVLASGIVTKFKKGRKSTTEYTFNLERLKELAVPFRHPEPVLEPEEIEESDNVVLLAQEWNTRMRMDNDLSEYDHDPEDALYSERRCNSEKIEALIAKEGDAKLVCSIIRWAMVIINEGRLGDYFPGAKPGNKRGWNAVEKKWGELKEKYLAETKNGGPKVSAFEIEED